MVPKNIHTDSALFKFESQVFMMLWVIGVYELNYSNKTVPRDILTLKGNITYKEAFHSKTNPLLILIHYTNL